MLLNPQILLFLQDFLFGCGYAALGYYDTKLRYFNKISCLAAVAL